MAKQNQDNYVYIISMVIMVALVMIGLFASDAFAAATGNIFNFLSKYFGWWYMLAMNCFVIFPIVLACSRFGKLKLGEADSRPEFSNVAWFGMLFGAGMGVGLVFYGVGEPLYHFATPPFGAVAGSPQAAEDAMRASFFHWGLHPWAGYSVIALGLAYFQFRKGAPGLMSSLFIPILGENAHRTLVGRAVDVFTIFATVGGIATSLGLAALQLNSGLKYMFDLPQSASIQLAIIAVLGVAYTGTAVSGIDKGIKFLGNLNLGLVCLLAGGLLLFGPTLIIFETLVTGIGGYLSNLVSESFSVAPYGGEYKSWLSSWTIYYWAWWIAWAPFVGSFIARISRGRSIRQFVIGVLMVPALGSFCWFAIFGGTGLNLQLSGVADLASVVSADISTGVFAMYQHISMGGIMSAVMLLLIGTFFVTSGNSSTFVLSMYSTHGVLNPPKSRMVVWGTLQAAFAFVLLLTGGLKALQIASITAAGPFSFIMILACVCLWRALNKEFAPGAEIK
ncbi:MAG: BCCT family transporter [Deltaproteobacteria bacterium]|jgi:glycine betaine transporter|nr:BCCT family transporter [Deltaproteobacteria bacterium]